MPQARREQLQNCPWKGLGLQFEHGRAAILPSFHTRDRASALTWQLLCPVLPCPRF